MISDNVGPKVDNVLIVEREKDPLCHGYFIQNMMTNVMQTTGG